MKTPEEIKKGLERCADGDCHKCPYSGYECAQEVNADGLAYIRQLEAELEAVKRERDAAVTILESIKTCDTCINKVEAETTYISTDCFHCINMSEHKFRGVCPENTEEDK